MQHRDFIIINKIIKEIEIANEMVGDVYNSIKIDFPEIKEKLRLILEIERI